MRKTQSFFLIYFGLLAGSLLWSSCCEEIMRVIGTGTFLAQEIDDPNAEVIRAPFHLSVYLETEIIAEAPVGMISPSYATTCDREYDNEILVESRVLRCDLPFLFNGDTILAGENLLDLPGVAQFQSNEVYWQRFTFDSLFLSQAIIPNGLYQFQYEMETDDGVMLSDSLQVEILLN